MSLRLRFQPFRRPRFRTSVSIALGVSVSAGRGSGGSGAARAVLFVCFLAMLGIAWALRHG